jgi:BirA family biotin operon repressor/biotin-[acetyl-CoA-carboxylase] ligase
VVRPPLRAPELPAGGLWTALKVVEETGSTNADVVAAAAAGAAEGLVVVAEYQRAGRGRLGRGWSAPPRSGLTASFLLRPGAAVPAARWGWLPLLAGVALVRAVRALTGVDARLKWPNDLLVDGRKCGGILVEVAEDRAVAVGIGVNVTLAAAELPPRAPGAPSATSLALAGARRTDRGRLLQALLGEIERWYGAWRGAAGDAGVCGLWSAYVADCATVGAPVRAVLPDGSELTGTAEAVDADGRLVVREHTGDVRVMAAGDVVHLRRG